MLLSTLRGSVNSLIFLIRNVIAAQKVKVSGSTEYKGFYIGSLSSRHFVDAMALYSMLNKTPRPGICRRITYRITKQKMMFGIVDTASNLVGIEIFYFNERDVNEDTVHEGFVGIKGGYRGLGLASKLRSHSLAHFRDSGFTGVSSRISVSNLPSLRSAEKLGFEPVERYHDKVMNEERYYLICLLKDSSENVE